MKKKKGIINTFSSNFYGNLNIKIPVLKFSILEKGINAHEVDGMWNIFVYNQAVYFSRRYTDKCIYRIIVSIREDCVFMGKFQVALPKGNLDIEFHAKVIMHMLQMYLEIENLYIDERMTLPLVKQVIEDFESKNKKFVVVLVVF